MGSDLPKRPRWIDKEAVVEDEVGQAIDALRGDLLERRLAR
jgi:hypothetical protein